MSILAKSRTAILITVLAVAACADGRPKFDAADPSAPWMVDPRNISDADDLLIRAEAAERAGALRYAADFYQRARHINRKSKTREAAPLVGLGRTMLALGGYNEAADAFRAAIEMTRRDREARVGLGYALLALNQPLVAKEQFAAAIESLPSPMGFNGLGVANDMVKDHAAAQISYQDGLDMDGENRLLRNNMGLSLALSGKFEEALRLLGEQGAGVNATARERLNLALAHSLAGNDRASHDAVVFDIDRRAARQFVQRTHTLAELRKEWREDGIVVAEAIPPTATKAENAETGVVPVPLGAGAAAPLPPLQTTPLPPLQAAETLPGAAPKPDAAPQTGATPRPAGPHMMSMPIPVPVPVPVPVPGIASAPVPEISPSVAMEPGKLQMWPAPSKLPEPNPATAPAPAPQGAQAHLPPPGPPAASPVPPPAPPAPSGHADPNYIPVEEWAPAPRRQPQIAAAPLPLPSVAANPAAPARQAALGPASVPAAPAAASGGRRFQVQLGSFRQRGGVDRHWTQITSSAPDLFKGVGRVVEEARVRRKRYYRLRTVPLDDRAAARNLCDRLIARAISCLVVATRPGARS